MLRFLEMAPVLLLSSALIFLPLTIAQTSATYTKIGVLSYIVTNSHPVKF
jgi:hypothetical protein